MDEPTLGLDVLTNRLILDFIRHERELGKAILLSTHHLDEAEALCDRIGLLHEGRLIAEGRPGDAEKPGRLPAADGRVPAADRSGHVADLVGDPVGRRGGRMSRRIRIGAIYRKELVNILRDRRAMLAMIIIPVVMYPALMLGFVRAVESDEMQLRSQNFVIEAGFAGGGG